MSEEVIAMIVVYGTPVVVAVGGYLLARKKRRQQRALEVALGGDVDVLPTGGSVMGFRARRAGRILEARALVDHKRQPWFIMSTRKSALGTRTIALGLEMRPVPIDDRRVDDTIRIASSDPRAVRAWLEHDEVTDALRRFLSRGDVLRAEIELDGDAMVRVRNRGLTAVHILDAFAEASGLLAIVDGHADLLAGVAITIEGGESTRAVEEAVGASSGTPFGISTSDRK